MATIHQSQSRIRLRKPENLVVLDVDLRCRRVSERNGPVSISGCVSMSLVLAGFETECVATGRADPRDQVSPLHFESFAEGVKIGLGVVKLCSETVNFFFVPC